VVRRLASILIGDCADRCARLGETMLNSHPGAGARVEVLRIQFTPDLMPTDIVGTGSWWTRTGGAVHCFGPVFANLVLADEINRATLRPNLPCSKPCRSIRSP
jgi:hypothetical protein